MASAEQFSGGRIDSLPGAAGAAAAAPRLLDGTCPSAVIRASMIHRWDNLTFVHWSFDPQVVQALLPDGLVVDTYDGRAWVGLVPFSMQVRLARGPAMPWVSNFHETNVRTYARAADGTSGVWFLSLDAARLGAVVVARTSYRLPYFWSKMSVTSSASTVIYQSQRRCPGPHGARADAIVEIGSPFGPSELTDFDHWLTARWRLYSAHARGLHAACADHSPWVLHHAELRHLDQDVLSAGGLPQPEGDPIVHWSPGVEVRIGYPHLLAAHARGEAIRP